MGPAKKNGSEEETTIVLLKNDRIMIHLCESTANDVSVFQDALDNSDGEEELEYFHAFKRMKRSNSKLTIRVFKGGKEGNYSAPFEEAVVKLQIWTKEVEIEYMDIDEIREEHSDWTHPRHLIDWLLKSDMHVILCQNIYLGFYGKWGISDTILELRRLEHHYGYPEGKQLRCSVFNGDKYNYLSRARKFCNPSVKLPLDMFKHKDKISFVENRKYRGILK